MAYSAIRALHNAKLVQNLKTVNFVIRNVIMRNGTVLFVNTDRDALLWRVTQHFARRAGQPYILHKWVGGTLTNFLATQRYYARKQHVSANIQSTPDLIFCSNVLENRRLFDEANTVMIPTVGIMHENTRNRLFTRDPHVTYPLPTFAPKSLSTIYFCNKIISDVILHHRRKQATYALYSIPPASTSAASTLLSPMARARLSTAMDGERTGVPKVAVGVNREQRWAVFPADDLEPRGDMVTRYVEISDSDAVPEGAELVSDNSEMEDAKEDMDDDEIASYTEEFKDFKRIEDASDSDRTGASNPLARLRLTPQGVRGAAPNSRAGYFTALGSPASASSASSTRAVNDDDAARYHDALQEIVGEDVRLDGPGVRAARGSSMAAALARARGQSSARVTGSAGESGRGSALQGPASAASVAAAKVEARKVARSAREKAAAHTTDVDRNFAFGAEYGRDGIVAVEGRQKYHKELFGGLRDAYRNMPFPQPKRWELSEDDNPTTSTSDDSGSEGEGEGEGDSADEFSDLDFDESDAYDASDASDSPGAPAAPAQPAPAAGAGAGAGNAARK